MNRPKLLTRRLIVRLTGAEMAVLVMIGVVQAAATVAVVLGIRRAIDEMQVVTNDTAQLWPSVIFVAIASLALAATRGVEYTVTERIGYRHVGRLRMTIYDKLTRLPARTVSGLSTGAILLRLTGDLSMLRTWLSRGAARAVVATITSAAGITVLFVLDPVYGVGVTGPLILMLGFALVAGHRVRRVTRIVRRRRSLIVSNLAEQIPALSTVRAFGRSAGERQRLDNQNDSLVEALTVSAGIRGWLRFWSNLASYSTVPMVLVIAALILPRGLTTIGDVVAAITAARLLGVSLRTLGRSYEYRQPAVVSSAKVASFLGRPEQVADPDPGESIVVRRGRVDIAGLTIDGALDDVDLGFEPGTMTAIIGPNGAGKSTLLAAIARLVDPDAGMILVDGSDVTESTRRSLARSIGFVSGDLPLMRGTLRRNISYRNRTASAAEIDRVVQTCHIDDVIGDDPRGLDLWVEEGGTNLSSGSRQRVMLARAMVGNPRLLLLDEPTTYLDPATKEVIRGSIARYGGTVLWATNDPAEASLADRVVTLDEGRVVEVVDGPTYRRRVAGRRRVEAGEVIW